MLNIRDATLTDVPTLHSLIHQMSEYEHLPFSITEQILASDGFGVQPRFRAMIAEFDDQPAGYAFFFESDSTFQGRGLFLKIYCSTSVPQEPNRLGTIVTRRQGCPTREVFRSNATRP